MILVSGFSLDNTSLRVLYKRIMLTVNPGVVQRLKYPQISRACLFTNECWNKMLPTLYTICSHSLFLGRP